MFLFYYKENILAFYGYLSPQHRFLLLEQLGCSVCRGLKTEGVFKVFGIAFVSI